MATHENDVKIDNPRLDALIKKIDNDLTQFFQGDDLDIEATLTRMDLESLRSKVSNDVIASLEDANEFIADYENQYQQIANKYQNQDYENIIPPADIIQTKATFEPPIKTTDYTTHKLLEIPAKVDIADLGSENKLLSQTEIDLIKSANLDNGRMRKEWLREIKGLEGINYAVIRNGDDYYAVYRGQHHGKELFYSKTNNRLVKLVQNIDTGEWGVLKIEKFDTSKFLDYESIDNYLQTETAGMQSVNLLITSYQRANKDETSYQNEFVMKHMPVDMLQFIRQNRFMPESTWLDIGMNLLDKAINLREKNILHRDIKVENIMINNDNEVVLIDFGLAVKVADNQPFAFQDYSVGTPNYKSPEISSETDLVVYDEKSEVFAYGQVLAEWFALTKDLQFRAMIDDASDPDQHQVVDGVIRSKPPLTTIQTRIAVYNLVKSMRDENPDKRPTLSEARKSLKEILDNQVQAKSRWIRVGYLDMNDYRQASDNQKNEMINALQWVDQIYLVGNKSDSNEILANDIRSKQELLNAGLRIQNDMILSDTNIATAINEHTKEYAKQHPGNYYNNVLISSAEISEQILVNNNIAHIRPDENNPESIDEYGNEIDYKINQLPVTETDLAKATDEINNRYTDYLSMLYDVDDPVKKLYANAHAAAENDILIASNYTDLVNALSAHGMNLFDISLLVKQRDQLIENTNLTATAFQFSENSEHLKNEIINNLNTLFDEPDFDQALLQQKLDNASDKINKLNESAVADEARYQAETIKGYKNTLENKLTRYHHELQEILEKTIVLEECLYNPEISLSQTQEHDIRRQVQRGYQLISQSTAATNEIRMLLETPNLTASQFDQAYKRISQPDINSINVVIDYLRDQQGDDVYQEVLDDARSIMKLSSKEIPAQDQMRANAITILEKMNVDKSDIWRMDLFNARMNDIINSANDPDFNTRGQQYTHYIQEYFDVNHGTFKPEYQNDEEFPWKYLKGSSIVYRKMDQAVKTLANHNFLVPYDDAIRELDSIIENPIKNAHLFDNWKYEETGIACVVGLDDDKRDLINSKIAYAGVQVGYQTISPKRTEYQKEYDFKKYQQEQKKLHALGKKLDDLVAKNAHKPADDISQNKMLVKKLNRAEERIRKQLQFLQDTWPTHYATITRLQPENAQHVMDMQKFVTHEAKRSLIEASQFSPFEQRMKLNEDIYAEIKNDVTRLLSDYDTHPPENKIEAIGNIMKNIDRTTHQYNAMHRSKRSWLKKLRGGEVYKLLRNERKSIRDLSERKIKLRQELAIHQADENIKANLETMQNAITTIKQQLADTPMDKQRKDRLDSRLALLNERITEVNGLKYEGKDIKVKSDMVSKIQSDFTKLMSSEIKALQTESRQIIAYMKSAGISESKKILDKKLEIAQLGTMMKDNESYSSDSIGMHFARVSQIRMDIDRESKNTLINHVEKINQNNMDLLTNIRGSQPRESDNAINQAYKKFTTKHQEIDSAIHNRNITANELIEVAKQADSYREELSSMNFSTDETLAKNQRQMLNMLDDIKKNDVQKLETLISGYNFPESDDISNLENDFAIHTDIANIQKIAINAQNFESIMSQLNDLKLECEDHSNSPALKNDIMREKVAVMDSALRYVSPSYSHYENMNHLLNELNTEYENSVYLTAMQSVVQKELTHLNSMISDHTKSNEFKNRIEKVRKNLVIQQKILADAEKRPASQQTTIINNSRTIIGNLVLSSMMNTLDERASANNDVLYRDHYSAFANNNRMKPDYEIIFDKNNVMHARLHEKINKSAEMIVEPVAPPRTISELESRSLDSNIPSQYIHEENVADVEASEQTNKLKVESLDLEEDKYVDDVINMINKSNILSNQVNKLLSNLDKMRLPEISQANSTDISLIANHEARKQLSDNLNKIAYDLDHEATPENIGDIEASLKQYQKEFKTFTSKIILHANLMKEKTAAPVPAKEKFKSSKEKISLPAADLQSRTIALDAPTKEENLELIQYNMINRKKIPNAEVVFITSRTPAKNITDDNTMQINPPQDFQYQRAKSGGLFDRTQHDVNIVLASGKLDGKDIMAFAFPRDEIANLNDKAYLIIAAQIMNAARAATLDLPSNFPPKIAMAMVAYKQNANHPEQLPTLNIEKRLVNTKPMADYSAKIKKLMDDPDVKRQIEGTPKPPAPKLK